MSEMIDRVAAAICVANASENNDYMWMARAAIEVMREPTDAMIEAGLKELQPGGRFSMLAAWQAALDEELRNKPKHLTLDVEEKST